MNTKTYTSLLANTSQIKGEDLSALHKVVANYPYFQSARALVLKGLKTEGSFRYNDTLKVTAAHTTNRDILFHYITSNKFEQHEISQQVLQHDTAANEIEISVEDVSASVSLELDKQIKGEIQKAEAILDPTLFERKAGEVKKILTHQELLKRASEILRGEDKSIDQNNAVTKANDKNVFKEKKTEERGKRKEERTKTLPSKEETPRPTISQAPVVAHEIEIDAPLAFKREDTHSFGEWLKLTQATPIEREEIKEDEKTIISEQRAENEKLRKYQLIEKFIQDRPKIVPKEKNSLPKNIGKPYVESSNSLMTETLAKVYLQQKNYKKAIQAYKILILKNPEKSGFFADQIRAVEKLKNIEES